jgi:hypothetical protein
MKPKNRSLDSFSSFVVENLHVSLKITEQNSCGTIGLFSPRKNAGSSRTKDDDDNES